MDPAFMIGSQSPGGHHTVEVRMEKQVLSPCMENGQEADLHSQVLRICRDFEHRCGARLKQQAIKDGRFRQSGFSSCGSVKTT